MADRLTRIASLSRIGLVIQYVAGQARELGIKRQSYHFSPSFEVPTSARTTVFAEGFDRAWLDLYDREEFRALDPIPERTMRHGKLLEWTDAMTIERNTADHERYFAAMRKHGLLHGFGLPVFGSLDRDAYSSFDFEKPLSEIPGDTIAMLKALAQSGHQRVCELLDAETKRPTLSEREAETLQWLARGKSITDTATILDLSPDTVKTYVRRVYEKLDANDRIEAVVKGLRLRLIHFQ